MTFFFCWVPGPQPFHPSHHLKRDLDIFSLSLTQEENTPARLQIAVSATTPRPSQKWGMLSVRLPSGETRCLFQGLLQETIQTGPENLVILTLIATPPDESLQLQHLLKKWQMTSPVYEPLLIPQGHEEDPHMIRFFQPYTFYWDPVTLKIHLDEIWRADVSFDATSLFNPASLTVHAKKERAFSLQVTLQAQWIQELNGFMNLGPTLAKLFSEGVINTYTGPSFKAAWPRAGHHLGRSGYWVTASRLEEIDPPSDFSPTSPPLSSLDPSCSKPLVAKRRWFRGKLLVGWTFQQKRVENIAFTFEAASASTASPPLTETLSLKLQSLNLLSPCPLWEANKTYKLGTRIQGGDETYLCVTPHTSSDLFETDQTYWKRDSPSSQSLPSADIASFFLTPRGQKVLESGMEIAYTKHMANARNLEISFNIGAAICPFLSPQDTVALKDPRLGHQPLVGKVLKTTLKVDGQTGNQIRTLTVGVMEKGIPSFTHSLSDTNRQTPSGIPYGAYNSQKPSDVHASLHKTRDALRIKKLALLNGPDVQEALLKEAYTHSIRPVFHDAQTRILLKFHKLKTQDALTHHIHVTIPSFFNKPPDKETTHAS